MASPPLLPTDTATLLGPAWPFGVKAQPRSATSTHSQLRTLVTFQGYLNRFYYAGSGFR